jgi:hypothetical protein
VRRYLKEASGKSGSLRTETGYKAFHPGYLALDRNALQLNVNDG